MTTSINSEAHDKRGLTNGQRESSKCSVFIKRNKKKEKKGHKDLRHKE